MRRHHVHGLQLAASTGAIAASLFMYAAANGQAIIYVDDDAAAGGDGASWRTAFNNLQNALAIAKSGDEIRIAQGIYKPAPPGGSRDATFQLVNGTRLRGGYAGVTANDPNANDPAIYKSILSGDLNGDDEANWLNRGDNCYNVAFADASDFTTVLRGIEIRGGHADFYDVGSWTDRRAFGGGVSGINGASLTLFDCVVQDNKSVFGGGGGIRASALRLKRCRFEQNVTAIGTSGPGGALLIGGPSVIEECSFDSNSTGDFGGAISGWANTATILICRCRFVSNYANEAGGALAGTGLKVIDSMFSGNIGANSAGGFYGQRSTFVNCVFVQNSGACTFQAGSAIGSYENTAVVNCLFSGNHGSNGTFAVYPPDSTSPHRIINCTFIGNDSPTCSGGAIIANHATVVENTVLWDNTYWNNPPTSNPVQSSQIRALAGTTLTNNWIQGWDGTLGGSNNFGNDPRLIDAAGSDGVYGTEDDNPRLLPNSPLINRGDNSALPPDEYDLDHDGDTSELLPIDLDGLPRIIGGTVDIGGYEFQGEPCLADITGSGRVDVSDLLAVINAWGRCVAGQPCNTDLTLDGATNVSDLQLVINHWGACR